MIACAFAARRQMKTVLIVDGADNCAYDFFGASDGLFRIIFPEEGQDIEFIEDLLDRESEDYLEPLFRAMWANPIHKKHVNGIDGILFYELHSRKKKFYPNKRDSDLDQIGRSFSTVGLLQEYIKR